MELYARITKRLEAGLQQIALGKSCITDPVYHIIDPRPTAEVGKRDRRPAGSCCGSGKRQRRAERKNCCRQRGDDAAEQRDRAERRERASTRSSGSRRSQSAHGAG